MAESDPSNDVEDYLITNAEPIANHMFANGKFLSGDHGKTTYITSADKEYAARLKAAASDLASMQ